MENPPSTAWKSQTCFHTVKTVEHGFHAMEFPPLSQSVTTPPSEGVVNGDKFGVHAVELFEVPRRFRFEARVVHKSYQQTSANLSSNQTQNFISLFCSCHAEAIA